MTHRSFSVIAVALFLAPSLLGGAGLAVAAAPSLAGVLPHLTRAGPVPAASGAKPFSFVSNFEDHQLDGWHAVNGTASVVPSPAYDGEPSLASTRGTAAQVDVATRNFTLGQKSISMEGVLDYGAGGVGIFGLESANGSLVAFVGAVGGGPVGVVFAGSSLATATNITTIPNVTAQPTGWVSLYANVYALTNASGTHWVMDVFVDRTDVAAATHISVPLAGTYHGAILETLCYTVYYTDFVYTTNAIATELAGYNNMDGYGQGSGSNVALLPSFTTLSATMFLDNWTTPQANILSFQINAMNVAGATRNTCSGFFQLGVDLNPGGKIAPWYVPNGNCVPYYFNSANPLKASAGFASPPGSRLGLKIVDSPTAKTITFTITDYAVTGANHTVSATISYNGTEFEAVYSQIEWQPCCSKSAIGSYFLNGTLNKITISGGNVSTPAALGAWYMLPFALDVPPSWSMFYYNQAAVGYDQIG